MLLEYYDSSGSGKGQARKDLAEKLGLSVVALRNHVEKIRRRVIAEISAIDSPAEAQFTAYYSRTIDLRTLSTILGAMFRSGEKWAPALLKRIEESEIFQFLWSEAAKRSAYVRQEWRHALSLHRDFFIRPVYWEHPMPQPPQELEEIHFAYLQLRDNEHL